MATNFSAEFLLTIICFCLSRITTAQWILEEDGCQTPDGSVGSCIIVNECKQITDYIRQNMPLTPRSIAFLQSYQCGFESSSVKVCCPDGPIEMDKSSSPPDVSNHRNINLLPFECGMQANKDKIIGGTRTVLFEFPWMALLSYETSSGPDFRCGGTVINDLYILTAAHCITQLSSLTLIGVRIGEYNLDTESDCERETFGTEWCAPPVQDMRIAEVIPHPRYNSTTFSDDIGLLRLFSRINITVESVKPICLPTSRELAGLNFVNSRLTVSGWGTTETGRRSSLLMKVDVPVTTPESCRQAYQRTGAVLTNKHLCAGGRNLSDSCSGDSGGPLKRIENYRNDARYVQFGVVSFGPRFCGQEGFPGVYTRVDYYMDWILDNIKP